MKIAANLPSIARRVAVATAHRLRRVVPPEFEVHVTNSGVVWVRHRDSGERAGADVFAILEGNPNLMKGIAMAAHHVLDTAQDFVSASTRNPWPQHDGDYNLAAYAQVEGDRVTLWYGKQGRQMIPLRPLRVEELLSN